MEIAAADLQINGGTASAEVNVRAEVPNKAGESGHRVMTADLPVLFVRTETGWQWGGPDLTWVTSTVSQVNTSVQQPVFEVAYPPQVNSDLSPVRQMAARQYREMADLLGLPSSTQSRLLLFADAEAIRVNTALSLPADQDVWVEPQMVKLVYRENITQTYRLDDALSQLLLANAGVTEEAAPWLWQGLPLALRARRDLVEVHGRYLPALNDMLGEGVLTGGPAASWAAVEFLKEQVGWPGLGQLIAGLGRACRQGQCRSQAGIDSALGIRLGMDTEAFEVAREEYWRRRLAAVQSDLDKLLAARMEAVATGDGSAFLRTVDPNQPGLPSAERYWFTDLAEHTVDSFTLEGNPVALFPDGDVLADVTLTYMLDENGDANLEESQSLTILFTPGDGGFRWAGVSLDSASTPLVTLRYPEAQEELAKVLLAEAENYYNQLAIIVGVDSPEPLMLELYPKRDSFRTAISLAFPEAEWIQAWSEPGTAVKLWVRPGVPAEAYRQALIGELARQLLYQLEVDAEWLLKGVSAYLARPLDGGLTQAAVVNTLPEIVESARDGRSGRSGRNAARCSSVTSGRTGGQGRGLGQHPILVGQLWLAIADGSIGAPGAGR